MKTHTSAGWLKSAFAVAAIALSWPAFAANWSREEVALARAGTRAKAVSARDATAARCGCTPGCAHAAAAATKASGVAAPSSASAP
jgi:hypothetical protein